jgi:hypothetical protein
VKHAKAANTPKRHEPNVNAPANFAPSGLIVTHPDGAYMLVKALPGGWVQASDQHKRETAYGGSVSYEEAFEVLKEKHGL